MTQYKTNRINFDFERMFNCNYPFRFIGVCTKKGKLLEFVYRKNMMSLFSDTELNFSVLKTALISSIRNNELIVGKMLYTVTTFENVKRATIPIDDELLLLCSFEKNADDSVINDIFEIVKQLQTLTNNYDTKS